MYSQRGKATQYNLHYEYTALAYRDGKDGPLFLQVDCIREGLLALGFTKNRQEGILNREHKTHRLKSDVVLFVEQYLSLLHCIQLTVALVLASRLSICVGMASPLNALSSLAIPLVVYTGTGCFCFPVIGALEPDESKVFDEALNKMGELSSQVKEIRRGWGKASRLRV